MSAAFANAPGAHGREGHHALRSPGGFPRLPRHGLMFYHLYNQTSYQALGELSPLSHSRGEHREARRHHPRVGGGVP